MYNPMTDAEIDRLKNRLRMDRPHPAPRGAIFDEPNT